MKKEKIVLSLSEESVSNFEHLLKIEFPKLKKQNVDFIDLSISLIVCFNDFYEMHIKITLGNFKNTFLVSYILYDANTEKEVASNIKNVNDIFTTLSLEFENDECEECQYTVVIKNLDKQ